MKVNVKLSKFIGYRREVSYELIICEEKQDETTIWEEDIVYKRFWDKNEVLSEIKNITGLSEKCIRNLGLNFKNSFSGFSTTVDKSQVL